MIGSRGLRSLPSRPKKRRNHCRPPVSGSLDHSPVIQTTNPNDLPENSARNICRRHGFWVEGRPVIDGRTSAPRRSLRASRAARRLDRQRRKASSTLSRDNPSTLAPVGWISAYRSRSGSISAERLSSAVARASSVLTSVSRRPLASLCVCRKIRLEKEILKAAASTNDMFGRGRIAPLRRRAAAHHEVAFGQGRAGLASASSLTSGLVERGQRRDPQQRKVHARQHAGGFRLPQIKQSAPPTRADRHRRAWGWLDAERRAVASLRQRPASHSDNGRLVSRADRFRAFPRSRSHPHAAQDGCGPGS